MTETRVMEACHQCRAFWYRDIEAPKCADPSHAHQLFEVHRHRSVVVLPDSTEVVAVSFDAIDPYTRERTPDYGLYLDPLWQPAWPHDHLSWPDFGVPDDATRVIAVLASALERARSGACVEVGCLGGHGRTGTALACLAVLVGHPPGDAVSWVRSNYCSQAVETPEQETFVLTLLD